MEHIILIGFMGSGKTTIGKRLAKATGWTFTDTDERIEKAQGTSISAMFAERGEQYFRDLETDMLKTLQSEEEPLVISVGGGLPVRAENRKLMRELGKVVYLTADVETLMHRLRGDRTRPMLQSGVSLKDRIEELMAARGALYEDAADVKVATDGKSRETIVNEILDALRSQ